MNYSAVAPPGQPGSADPQSAFADALARARQIAAKINQPTGESTESVPLKRPFEGTTENQPDPKKMAALNDPIGAQLRAIADQQRASQAAQAAAAAASQINAKLGISSSQSSGDEGRNGGMPHSPPGMGMGPGSGMGMGMVTTENFSVPDRMVGLIIGKGGEQIASIQNETGCKVQFAPDSGGMPERPCTLTGPNDAIMRAKEMVQRIISKGQGLPDPSQLGDGHTMLEVMIPGNKVGLVIGKNGETIKQLQEEACVKMVMIQDSNIPTHQEKPLRITGDLQRCQRAKELVVELIAEKDMQSGFGEYGNSRDSGNGGGGGGGGGRMGGGGGGGGGGVGGGGGMEIPVPRTLVGVIIGKGGEMIKKIQNESGAKVQFKADDGQGPDRLCSVMGGPEKVQVAANMIHDLINQAMARDNDRGRGRGRGDRNSRFDERRPGEGPPRFGEFGGGDADASYTVPADKCGLVIGKGGETIREINRQAGAHVELARNQPPNPRERVFKIAGNPDQVQHAIRLICEKAGLPMGGPERGGPPGGPGGPHGPGGPGGPPGPGGPGGYDQFGPGNGPPQFGQQFGQHNQQQGPPPPQQQQGGPNYAPQGWGNAYQQWNQANPQDPNKQAADANAAAWAAYYAQYYQGGQPPAQGGQPPQQQGQPPHQQPPQQQQQQQQQPPQQQQPQQQQAQPQPSVNPVTGQLDYSAAWAEYYRQQGMHYHAQAILAQAQQSGGGQPAPGAAPQPQ